MDESRPQSNTNTEKKSKSHLCTEIDVKVVDSNAEMHHSTDPNEDVGLVRCETEPHSCKETDDEEGGLGVVKHESSNDHSSPLPSDDHSYSEDGSVPVSSEDIIVKDHSSKYPYTARGFTSEIYKIEITNLPPFVGFKQLKKRLKGLKLDPVKVKIGPNKSWCFVTFRNEEDRQAALKLINGHVWKKMKLKATFAAPAHDPLDKRKREMSDSDLLDTKQQHLDPTMNITERLTSVVTPLLDKPYPEQLEMKMTIMREFLCNAADQVLRKGKPGAWFQKHVSFTKGRMLCPLDPIRASPVLDNYRNKCDFTAGLDQLGEPVVGFRLGSYKDGDLTVVSPDTCAHVPQAMKDFTKSFATYIKESGKAPFDPHKYEGYWRGVTLRCFTTGQTMVTVQIHPQQLSQEEIDSEKRQLANYYSTGEGSQFRPTSLYFQAVGQKSFETAEYSHLLGEQYVMEELLGLKFRVSPDAFFQVNTAAAGALYSTIFELCNVKDEDIGHTSVYDICCGTGTIGLCLAKRFQIGRLVGVELSQQAVEDACYNAALNNTRATQFMCGKAEEVLPSLMAEERRMAIALADPPRSGLHQRVVQAIRQCGCIQKLVYASCSPAGALNNIIEPQSNRMKGLPFRPVRAVPVDIFPHTTHCELVLLFERITPSDLNPNKDMHEV